MKKLNPIAHDDFAHLDWLSSKRSAPKLEEFHDQLGLVVGAYNDYHDSCGDPVKYSSPAISDAFQERMEILYSSKHTRFDYIRKIREEMSPDLCPCCGSLSTSQVDHYLPRCDYKELSIFRLNLVPACSCNNKKGDKTSSVAGEKFLHPYYDEILRNRLFVSSFQGSFDEPSIEVVPVDSNHASIVTIRYHLENLLLKTNIVNWLANEWSKTRRLLENGSQTIFSGLETPVNSAAVLERLTEKIQEYDTEFDTPNNWKSIFLMGIKDNNYFVDEISKGL